MLYAIVLKCKCNVLSRAPLIGALQFACGCERCSLEGPDLLADDELQMEIKDLDQSIKQTAPRDPLLALKYCEERVGLLEDDGFVDPCEFVRTEFDAFQICLQERSGKLIAQASWWIAQAYLHSAMARGATHVQTVRLEKFMNDPCSLPAVAEAIAEGSLPSDFQTQVNRAFVA